MSALPPQPIQIPGRDPLPFVFRALPRPERAHYRGQPVMVLGWWQRGARRVFACYVPANASVARAEEIEPGEPVR